MRRDNTSPHRRRELPCGPTTFLAMPITLLAIRNLLECDYRMVPIRRYIGRSQVRPGTPEAKLALDSRPPRIVCGDRSNLLQNFSRSRRVDSNVWTRLGMPGQVLCG